MDKKVLIISYYWPPAGGPGVQRWMKFVKYLPEYNIKPILYIPENPNYPIYDYSLNDEVSEKLEIIKNPITEISNIISNSKSLNLIRSGNIPNPKEQSLFQRLLFFIRGNLFIPDMKILWKNKSIDFIENYLSKTKIDVVITTGPPHSLHLIGYELKKRLNIKWISDFRDPWVNLNYLNRFHLLPSVKRRHKKLRDKVLINSNSVIVTSEKLKKLYKEIAPNIFKITNGYDYEYSTVNIDSKFSISHIGSLYPERNPKYLWDIIDEICINNEEFRSNLQINFIGNTSEKIIKYLSNKTFKSCVKFFDYVDYKRAIEFMCSSQILLMVEVNDNDSSYAIPGKLFDYLNSKRPIIAIGPDRSEVNQILYDTNAGKFFNYNESINLKLHIENLYNQYEMGSISYDAKNISIYRRKNLTEELSKIINKVSS
ncbi:MAG: glycosyl transferase family 1 [Flavobacteriaceae bacterium]